MTTTTAPATLAEAPLPRVGATPWLRHVLLAVAGST